jgi:TolA-binding protein
MKQFLSAAILVMISVISVHSQQTVRYDDPEAGYYLGLELFNKEKYSASKEIFSHLVTIISDKNSGIRVSSEYHKALCAYELSNNDAKYLLEQFIQNHPESAGVQHAYFQLGKICYRDKDYRDALVYFGKTDIRQLTNKEVAEYYFRKGYSYMKEKQYKEAREAFFEIIDTESEYKNQATFYYSHIAYMENDLETAVTGFNKIKDDPGYSDIVPYYLIDIYYLQGNYDEVIRSSRSLLADKKNKQNSEISRIVAESYFKTRRYSEALPWFEAYFAEEKGKITRLDYYQIGYCYYQTSGYDKAAEALQKATGPADSLSQNAFYHLGSCYINKGEKKFAQGAFLSAYKLGFDKEIKENALFNYAKLSYELTYDPYNEAIKALRQYIADYPDSKRTDEAYSYLVDLFISTKNYREALETIDKIKTKDEKMLTAYQKITYYRGIEIFNDRDYFEAIKMLRKSLDYNYDKAITALANYWIGESYFRLSSFEFAQEYYKKFQALPAASQTDVFKRNAYDMGYSLYMQKKYAEAVTCFQKYINQSSAEPALITDACLRIGDSYFIDKKYDDAFAFYDKAIQRGGTGSDYAIYQKALAIGGKGDFAQKASLLQDFLWRFEKSVYAEDAIFELATTSLILNKDDQALTYFKQITDKYPSSRHVKKSLLKIGLIYFNRDNNDLAISTLKKVIQDYPGSIESKEALESLRDIYTDMNRVDEYSFCKPVSIAAGFADLYCK